jgi:diguanylate cyclase (GGDEF)-like protein
MAGVSMDTAPAAIKACVTLLGAKDFIQGVTQVLNDIIDFSGAFNCRIMLIKHEEKRAINFCEAYRDFSLIDTSVGTASIPYEVVASWEGIIGVSNNIIVKDSRDMDELERQNPDWVRTMRHYGVESLALVPLRRTSSIIGYLYVINFDVSRVVKVKELIELTSFFLTSEISNYLRMNQLEELSTVDTLTGLQNRNAMTRRIAEIDEGGTTPFGLVNIDLNGLKIANDRYGHEAGDELLRQAADILRQAFRQDDLYRMGGDEFLVIAVGISQEEFDRRVAILHDHMRGSAKVSFSIGALWSDGTTDVSTAYKHADAIMYADKEAYYASHPNLHRN